MRDTDLPSPNMGSEGFHLRRLVAKVVNSMSVVAPNYAYAHPSKTELIAFFTATIAAVNAIIAPPVNTVAPAVTGTLTVGSTLTTTNGTWTGSPTFTRQWRRRALDKQTSEAITGSVGLTYVLQAADSGHEVYCVVTGTNTGGYNVARSNYSAVA